MLLTTKAFRYIGNNSRQFVRLEPEHICESAAGINLSWYSLLRSPKSLQQKYSNGYWLQFYIYRDLMELGVRKQNQEFLNNLDKAYFSGNWKLVGKL